ncbi:MAG: aldo/keto reductase, partial [Saprospiraceae bacterium]|nr:aldo/keto reductase [Saprospiraceae bacterium]
MLQSTTLKEGGPIFSRLVWGMMTWGVWGRNYSPQEMLSLISYGVEQDITTYDHADIYGHYTTENTFGQALSLQPALRQKMQLISKCGIKLVTPNRA